MIWDWEQTARPGLGIARGIGWGILRSMAEHFGNGGSVPIYEALAERLRRSILAGDFGDGQLLGSEHELARQEGISRMTVRRASELLVNEGLLERRPGKGLFVRGGGRGVQKTRTVQLVAGNMAWEPSLQVSRGASVVAKEQGIQVLIYDAHGDLGLDLEMLRQLPASKTSGAVIMSVHDPAFNEAVYQLKSANFPFVLIDQSLQDISVPSVTADNYSGGYKAGEALLRLGHRHMAFLGESVATSVRDRLAGFRDAIADAGLPFDRSLVMDVLNDQSRFDDLSGNVGKCLAELMSRPVRPTAIFCFCDSVARSAYRSFSQMGIRIPDDVSIIGFDDDPMAEWLTPGLATIRQPFAEMGRVAMELLCRRIDDAHSPVERRVLPVEFIQRASVGPPAQR